MGKSVNEDSPHCRAVKCNQHPLMRVEIEGVSKLYPRHEVTIFRTYKRRSCIITNVINNYLELTKN